MNNINLNNYEAYLLDYVEQNLSPDMVAELMLFLEQHPEVKAELEAFENVTLNFEKSTFNDKQNLKKIAIEDLMIAELEGLNTPQETEALNQEIKENKNYSALFTRYQKTILVPEHIVFAYKENLKLKETKVVPLYWWISSAAAMLVVFFLLKNFNNDVVEKVASSLPSVVETPLKVKNVQLPVIKKDLATLPEKNNSQQTVKDTQLLYNRKKSSGLVNKKTLEPLHKTIYSDQSITDNQSPINNNQQPAIKNMITINPPKKEYIEIEPYVAEVNTPKQEEYLTVSELLKKEAQKRLLENEVKNNSTELMAANVVAKVFGKNAEVETAENENGEVKEYALNIGGFSISRKIRK